MRFFSLTDFAYTSKTHSNPYRSDCPSQCHASMSFPFLTWTQLTLLLANVILIKCQLYAVARSNGHMEPYNGIRSLQYLCKKQRTKAYIGASKYWFHGSSALGPGDVMCGIESQFGGRLPLGVASKWANAIIEVGNIRDKRNDWLESIIPSTHLRNPLWNGEG